MGAKPKNMSLMLALAALAFLPGCWTYSLHSLYRDDDPRLTYDPTLTGTWENRNSDCLVIAGDSKTQQYTLQLFDKGEIKCHYAPQACASCSQTGSTASSENCLTCALHPI